jgi:hypothetical protein
MVNVVPVPADIEKVSTSVSSSLVTLEASTTTAGGEVLRSTSAGYVLADNSSLTSVTFNGIALGKGSAGLTVDMWGTSGIGKVLDLGVAFTEGTVYVVSATAGKIAPYADLATGEFAYMVGIGNPDGNLFYQPAYLGIAT